MTDTPYRLRFLVLPDFIYSDNRLNATDIKVYSFINSYKGDKFYFTNEQLGVMFNCGDDSISRAIVRLTRFGYIETNYQIKAEGGKIRFIRNRKVAESEPAELTFKKPQIRRNKDNKIKESNTFTKVNGVADLEESNKGMKSLGDIFRKKGLDLIKPVEKIDKRIGQGWQYYAKEVVDVAGFKNGGRARVFQAFKSKNWGYAQAEKAKVVVKHANFIALKSEDDKVRYLIGAFKNG